MRIPTHTIQGGTVLSVVMRHVKHVAWEADKMDIKLYERVRVNGSLTRQPVLELIFTLIRASIKMSTFKYLCFFLLS